MWIEILQLEGVEKVILVTPLAGVWIEILLRRGRPPERSLVTPLAGVWIEIERLAKSAAHPVRHSPRGSVD